MVMDDPLDFEEEDLLLSNTRATTKRRRKVIGLDDLLTDYCIEKKKFVHCKSKRSNASKAYNSDEEDKKMRENEITFCKFVNNCQKQVNEIDTEDDVSLWGQKVFGQQKLPPVPEFSGLGNCNLLQSFSGNELTSAFDVNVGQGDTFLEGLLINGWLSTLAFRSGFVEDPIATWTLQKMLYSPNEELQVSACDFWCKILLSQNKGDQPLVKLGLFPSYSILQDALITYGYLYDTSYNCSSTSQDVPTDSLCEGPPGNISSWIRVLSACCQIRNVRPIFSTSEAEEFLIIVIFLFLDRQLQGLALILSACLQSIIYFFSESEWNVSCMKVAESIAHRVPKDLNCLRIVECITGVDNRSKHLRSQLALQILMKCFDRKVTDVKETLELLISTNVKEKSCNFFKLYIYLVLADNFLLSSHLFEERPVIIDMWCKYLRNCSSQITSTDWRSYASKVRNKASYLLQNMIPRRNSE
ncbi:uncharacterized protein [Typha angustifolia]|uniref:uncharacterized protein isoform X1 n=1 Tax=Typha angustifolia TaxID=59011 RepID=UPI003C2E7172